MRQPHYQQRLLQSHMAAKKHTNHMYGAQTVTSNE